MSPAVVSVLIGECPPDSADIRVIAQLGSVVRARLVLRGPLSALSPWLGLFADKRVSVDVRAEVLRAPAAQHALDPRVRQVRIAGARPDEIQGLVRLLRGDAGGPPIVFLVPAEDLPDSPEPWSAVGEATQVFVNPIATAREPALAAEEYWRGFARWRLLFRERLFASLPAVAARAEDPDAAPCPTLLGMHVVLDAIRRGIRLCDCIEEPMIPLHEGWLAHWRAELRAATERARGACDGCSLWRTCRGGCLAPRADGVPRDRYCPWPAGRFSPKAAG